MRTLLRPAAIVEAWFDMLPPGREPTMRALQAAVLGAGPELQQVVKWGNLVFSTRGAHAFAIVPHKSQAHLQVFRGASLEQRFPQLEGSGRGLRHLKFRYGQPIDQELVRTVVHAALELMHLPQDADEDNAGPEDA
jgi:hypothetical protein